MNDRYPLTCDYGETYASVEAGGTCATLINAALVGAALLYGFGQWAAGEKSAAA